MSCGGGGGIAEPARKSGHDGGQPHDHHPGKWNDAAKTSENQGRVKLAGCVLSPASRSGQTIFPDCNGLHVARSLERNVRQAASRIRRR